MQLRHGGESIQLDFTLAPSVNILFANIFSMERNIENNHNNRILDSDEGSETFEFKHNFVNEPWDDRSNKSKFGIIALLVAIFVSTMACVIYNFILHYESFGKAANNTNSEINCYRVKYEDYRFVARIHSMSSKELLCVGAVVSTTSILINGVCIKSGPIRIYLGSSAQPHCKKGFAVDVIETVFHEGTISKKLALLSSYDDISKCSSAIRIGSDLKWNVLAQVIGRPPHLSRALTRQHVSLVAKPNLPKGFTIKTLKVESMVCVTSYSRCPVRAGDLLVQDGILFGISSTSVHRMDESNLACFAELKIVRNELKELDTDIK